MFLDSPQKPYWKSPIYLETDGQIAVTEIVLFSLGNQSFECNGSDSHSTKKAIIGDMWAVKIPHPVK